MSSDVLTTRALNRAVLARQMLVRREKIKAVVAVERLAGMQAQIPRPPFVGLWSRVEGFQREHLIKSVESHELLRGTLMRGTLHLASRKDFNAFRNALAPDLARITKSILRDRADIVGLPRLISAARKFFDEEPRTFAEFREHVKTAFPGLDERAVAYTVRLHLPLIQAPRSGETWGYPANADFALAEQWLTDTNSKQTPQQHIALSYFAAFGPATVRDFACWSGLSGASAVVEELRPKLMTFRDEAKRELFDLPKAPRPDEDVPVPIRFLPEYDNLLLGHADRTRVVSNEHRPKLMTRNLFLPGTFLVDGFCAGIWKAEEKKKAAELAIYPFVRLSKQARVELEDEGEKLLQFMMPGAQSRSITFN